MLLCVDSSCTAFDQARATAQHTHRLVNNCTPTYIGIVGGRRYWLNLTCGGLFFLLRIAHCPTAGPILAMADDVAIREHAGFSGFTNGDISFGSSLKTTLLSVKDAIARKELQE